MIQVGATSYIVKTATPNEVVETINEVDKKGYYYNDSVLEIINESKFLPFNPINENLDEDLLLTKREKEILRLICFQLNSTQIAEKLQVSSRTIDTHRYNLQIKINSKNIAGMVVYAIQNKIINLEELALESNDVIVDYSKFSNN
jgi:DNA-binding NarL/FixJ family response regulator